MNSLPPNCIGSNSPIISCQPSKPGIYTISCAVKDSTGLTVSVSGTLKVKKK